MKKNKVVIVTHSNDNPSIDVVSEYLKERGVQAVRLNSDLFPTQVTIENHQTNEGSNNRLITEEGIEVESGDVFALWYRRFQPAKGLPKDMEASFKGPSAEESKRTLLGYMDSLDCFKLDDYWSIRHASNKEFQLMLARKVGLDLPNTLTTNSPKAVREFYHANQGNIITKMQTSFSVWEDGQEQVVFTNKIEEPHLEQLESLNLCPMVFQAHIEKEVELRATIVGNNVFCAAINPNEISGMELDWRKRGQHTLDKWMPYELPQDISDKLVQLTVALGLNYGAADIIVTPKGEYKFLEINPCGEFYWMDAFQQLGICEAIAENLLAGGRRKV
ncbi:hypothetical protein GCE9029_01201 [Grimontia celer]|uniref:MvdD-like pre-ATP grasp domain-containing protein n=1 Tax=Grimontia celer TaxID=1796497 RepID=A0A128EXS9_9GAMM|nr:hypothetical protein [Grimontia celer]CZF79015.1 hypothetical protein GCE9029_01201 [Grimontia celer]